MEERPELKQLDLFSLVWTLMKARVRQGDQTGGAIRAASCGMVLLAEERHYV